MTEGSSGGHCPPGGPTRASAPETLSKIQKARPAPSERAGFSLDMPDLGGVLTDGAVRRELSGGRRVHQTFAAKCDAVAIVAVRAQARVLIGLEVVQAEIVIRAMPARAVEQRSMNL